MIREAALEQEEPNESQLLMQLPSTYADPAWLIPCFNNTISLETSKQMLASQRLSKRLSKLLSEYYQLPSLPLAGSDIGEADQPVAFASADKLADIALQSGAVYWAATLARTISGFEAAALRDQLGAALCTSAVANKDLAGPEQSVDPIATLRERVVADGWRCLGAWCGAVSPAVAARARLKLPPHNPLEEPPTSSFKTIGPLIVRRVAR